MSGPNVCTTGLRLFLDFLAKRTTSGWRHLFVTTNWDYLLQREINSFIPVIPGNVKPAWLADSHVFHLNGTIEDPSDHPFRSPFMLPEDPHHQRAWTPEANIALNKVIWQGMIVVVGMSFECATD